MSHLHSLALPARASVRAVPVLREGRAKRPGEAILCHQEAASQKNARSDR